jgi:mono/diheme cytochrome c family protein
MKRLTSALLVFIALGVAGFFWLTRSDPSTGSAPDIRGAPPGRDLVARGEYLARAADCIACHTIAGGKPFAGGFAFKLPFGTIYSSNITADPETGIGKWTDDEFVRAVREGVRNDGAHLYPAFPYTSYTELSRADVIAIKAWLFSQPKVSQVNRPNDLGFPFNQRWVMAFWNAAFFRSHRFEKDASRSSQWNSGAYLAGALGHCGECHTPRNVGFAVESNNALAGEVVQGWRAYNITSDHEHGVGQWSDAALADYIRTGHADGHASAAGPMGEAVNHSLQYLTPEDAAALVSWLRTVPARKGSDAVTVDLKPAPMVASGAWTPVGDTDATAMGKRLFEGACASCHQWNGGGQQTRYASLAGTRGVNDPTGSNVTEIILEGVKMRVGGTDIYMPAFANSFSDAEIAALSNYVIAHFGGKRGVVTPDDVTKRREL